MKGVGVVGKNLGSVISDWDRDRAGLSRGVVMEGD